MFNRILFSAAVAGLLAAFSLTAVESFFVTPLILEAEKYEDAAEHSMPHEEHRHAWQPENGWQRTLATAASNGVMGIGYSLILCGIFALRKTPTLMQGIGWGLAGYCVFFAAPAIGLHPELPGTSAALLSSRQYWWLGTAAATALGLGLMILQRKNALRAAGALLLFLPHIIGAPHPPVTANLAPELLQMRFRTTAIFSNALFWLLLGVLSAALTRRQGD